MFKSDKLNELAKALCKVQAEIQTITKDSRNPFYNSEYAQLDTYLENVLPITSKNGLAVIQTHEIIDSNIYVETMLLHESDQFVTGRIKLLLGKQDMQQIGSATTYARRIGLAAILGLAETKDDDGNTVSNVKPQSKAPVRVPVTKEAPPAQAPPQGPSEAQIKRLWAIANKQKFDQAFVMDQLKTMCGKDDIKKLTWSEYSNFCQAMETGFSK